MQPIRTDDESSQNGPNWDYRVTAKEANLPFAAHEKGTQKRELQRKMTVAAPKRERNEASAAK